jgi:hypothetical protein
VNVKKRVSQRGRVRLHTAADRIADAAEAYKKAKSPAEQQSCFADLVGETLAFTMAVDLDIVVGARLMGASWGCHVSMCRALGKVFGDQADDAFSDGLRRALEVFGPDFARRARERRAVVRAARRAGQAP